MVLTRRLLGLRCEEYWFDREGFLRSTADIAALRTHEPHVSRRRGHSREDPGAVS